MKKIHFVSILVCLYSLVSVGPSAFASDSEPLPPLYSLHELSRKADKNGERILIALEDIRVAEEDKKRAFSVLIPRATLFGSHLNYGDDTSMASDSTTFGVKLTQSFTLNGKELIAYDVTKKEIEKSQFAYDSIRADYLLQVAQFYFQTLSAKRRNEIAIAEVKRLETHRDSVREKLIVGNVTKTDLFRAEAELSKARTSQVVAQNEILLRKADIARLTGIDENFRVSEKQVQSLENFKPVLEEIQASALENRNEVKEAQKALDIATQTIKFEKGDYWPSLDLEAGYKDMEISYDNVEEDNEDTYALAELSFTLFDGGLRKAQVRQARARERQAKQTLASVKNDILLESRTAFIEFETARTTLINLQDELTSARENYNAVQMQYQYGMADSIDMMDANTLLATAERRISDAEHILYLAALKILYAKSELLPYLLGGS